MQYRFIPISSVVDEYLQLTGEVDVDRDYFIQLADKLVRKMTFADQKLHKVVLRDVKDYRVRLPEDFDKLLQVAYRSNADGDKVSISQVKEWITSHGSCDVKVNVECDNCDENGSILFDLTQQAIKRNPQWVYGNIKWYLKHGGVTDRGYVRSLYYPEFRVIRYADSSMFGANYHVKGCLNIQGKLGIDTGVFYVVEPDGYIRLNVRDGQVLIAYLAVVLDKNGYRMIPENEYLIEAIKWYIEEMMLYRKIRIGLKKDNMAFRLMERARQLKERAMGYAISQLREIEFNKFYAMMQNIQKVEDYDLWYERYSRHEPDIYTLNMDRMYGK